MICHRVLSCKKTVRSDTPQDFRPLTSMLVGNKNARRRGREREKPRSLLPKGRRFCEFTIYLIWFFSKTNVESYLRDCLGIPISCANGSSKTVRSTFSKDLRFKAWLPWLWLPKPSKALILNPPPFPTRISISITFWINSTTISPAKNHPKTPGDVTHSTPHHHFQLSNTVPCCHRHPQTSPLGEAPQKR